MEKTMVRQTVPLQPMEDDGGADIHLQPMEDPMPEQVDAPKGGSDFMEAHAGASSWQDLWPCGERSPRQGRFAGRTCDPVGDPTLEQFGPEGLHPVGETHAGAVHEKL
ncbi:AN1-type zinc finger protein 5-like [Grus japonensis]|uniref:AN1-type zinc finger protein 5-like n=1 Tax=Grus japonensis TaxID=30415 RepID=A0ABC9WKR6_GRUJA